MYYSKEDKIEFEVGDIITNNNSYDRRLVVEVVTFVGNEGVVLQSLGGVVGMMERYVKYHRINDGWPKIFHKRNEKEYLEFIQSQKEKN